MALKKLGLDFEIVGTSEIDKFAIISYASIHNQSDEVEIDYPSKEEMIDYLKNKNIGLDFKTKKVKLPRNLKELKLLYKACILSKCYGDISLLNTDKLPDIDLFTYSFPCQDVSIAGLQKGLEQGQTRSGLLYECERIIEGKKPKYLLLENVKNLVSKKFKPQFEEWLEYLESLGYSNYWQVLNAKDYGIPQNRERVFVVSILNDDKKDFKFPSKQPLNLKLIDLLQTEIDEDLYINTERANTLISKLLEKDEIKNTVTRCDSTIMKPKALDVANAITARCNAGIQNQQSIGVAVCEKKEIIKVGDLEVDGWLDQSKRVYSGQGISPTLHTKIGSENGGIKILVPQATKQGYVEMSVPGVCDLSYPNSKTRRGRVQDCGQSCPTLTTEKQDICYIDKNEIDQYRIRRLSANECWRLMGISDEDFHKAEKHVSQSQLYKQAGNAIVVNVLEAIFRELFKNK